MPDRRCHRLRDLQALSATARTAEDRNALSSTPNPFTANPGLSRALTLLFSITCGLAVANVYYAQPLLDRMADEFGISHAAAGSIITVTQIGYGLGLLLVAPLGDLLDRRQLIIGKSLLSVIALTAVALAPTGAILLAAIAAVGVLATVTQVLVAYAAILADPSERGRAVGTVTSGIVIGILVARTVAGTLSDFFGWRSVYFASAVATLAIIALLFKWLPRQATPSAQMSFPRLIGSMLTLFAKEPTLRIRAILALLIFAAMATLLTPMVLPLAAPPFSLSHTQIGLFGLSAAAGALGASYAGRLADRGDAQRTTGAGLAFMLFSWLPSSLLSHTLWSLVIGVVALDFGLQSVHVSNQILIYRVQPAAQSRLAAGYMIFYSIGIAAGSIASTLVYAQAGWTGVCLLGAAISALAMVFWATTLRLPPEIAPSVADGPDFRPEKPDAL